MHMALALQIPNEERDHIFFSTPDWSKNEIEWFDFLSCFIPRILEFSRTHGWAFLDLHLYQSWSVVFFFSSTFFDEEIASFPIGILETI